MDVRHVIEYRNEVTAGGLLEIQACMTKIGNKSITVNYEMINLGNNKTAATLESVLVLFDLEKRTGLTITDDLRERASKHLVEQEDS